jgi:sporulation protein YlmC with PRC-barrel domain
MLLSSHLVLNVGVGNLWLTVFGVWFVRWCLVVMVNSINNSIEAELYELSIPGRFVGKEVIDGSARRIGIVRSVKIRVNPVKVEMVIKGLGVEFPVDIDNIQNVGNVIQLKNPVREAEDIEVKTVLMLRDELQEEVAAYLRP